VLLHELGQDLVLALQFIFAGSDRAVLGVLVGLAALAGVVEGGGPVLEELLRPVVEDVHREVVFLAEVGDGLLLQEVEARQGDLLFRGKVTTLPGQGCSSASVLPLIPAKASSSSG
jgi:hypothetical protein